MNQTRTNPTPAIWHFPQIWWHSLTDLRAYRSFIHLPAWFGFTYTFVLYGILAIFSTLVFSFRTLPAWTHLATSSWNELQTHWPNELVVRYENQELSFENLDEPFTVSYPSAFTVPEGFPSHLATIHSAVPASESPFETLDTSVLLGVTRDRLVIQPRKNLELTDTNSNTWAELLGEQSFIVQKSDLESHSDSITSGLIQTLRLLTVPYFFLAWIGVWIARIFFLTLYTLFAQTLFWMFGTKIRYTALFRLGLFTLPVVELIPLLWKAIYGSVLWTGSYWWVWLACMTFLAWYNRKGKILQL